MKVKLIPPKYFVAFAFVLIFIAADDLSHSCSHTYFTPNFTFAFAFMILKVILIRKYRWGRNHYILNSGELLKCM